MPSFAEFSLSHLQAATKNFSSDFPHSKPASLPSQSHSQMHKLIRRAAQGRLLPTLKVNQRRCCKNPKIFTSTSHHHSPTKTHVPNSKLGFVVREFEELQSSMPRSSSPATTSPEQPSENSRVHISHPWNC